MEQLSAKSGAHLRERQVHLLRLHHLLRHQGARVHEHSYSSPKRVQHHQKLRSKFLEPSQKYKHKPTQSTECPSPLLRAEGGVCVGEKRA